MTRRTLLTDRAALSLNRRRAEAIPQTFLHDVAAREIEERLSEINKSFTKPLLIGNASAPFRAMFPDAPVISDDDVLEVPSNDFDLAIHVFGLHWADDPVGQIVQSLRALKPDGLFLAVTFGGDTLSELRSALADAEIAVRGGLSPRVAPFGELRDLGALLQRAGAALPVADNLKTIVRYKTVRHIARDLRGMGEGNALAERDKTPLTRAMLTKVEEVYRHRFSDDEGYLLATFEMVFLTGWAPSPDQPRPLRPGSATTLLSDALGDRGDPET